MLQRYGVGGYARLLAGIVPEMLARKIDPQTIDLWLRTNPRNLYCWATH